MKIVLIMLQDPIFGFIVLESGKKCYKTYVMKIVAWRQKKPILGYIFKKDAKIDLVPPIMKIIHKNSILGYMVQES